MLPQPAPFRRGVRVGRSGSTWRQTARLVASDGTENDGFASSLAVSGDGTVVLVGAFGKDIGDNIAQGVAYVFTRSGGIWRQSSEITVASGASDDNFGTAVAVSADGGTVLVGAPNANATSQTAPGAVYVLTQPAPTGAWPPSSSLPTACQAIPSAMRWL